MADVKELLDLLSGKINKKDEELIKKAYDFSRKAHEGQKRRSGDPYFRHAFETAKLLANLRVSPKTIAAGLLHDVLEDTDVTEEQLEEAFGKDVTFLVKGVTKLGTLKYRGHQRHIESLRKFFVAIASDLRVVIIKFADRLHNLQTLSYLQEDKRKRIAVESIEVYAPLANRLGMGKLKGQLEDAAFPYAYPKEYAETEQILKGRREYYKKYLAEVREKLTHELRKNKIKIEEIDYRVKHKYSLYKKLLKYNMDLEKIYDIVALRVVVSSVEDCYKALGIIHSMWKPLPGRIKDYIAIPKPNGYRSIHTTVITGKNEVAEIQIRTQEMHAEAAYGIAAHFAYKEKALSTPKAKLGWMEELKDLNHIPDTPKKFMQDIKMDFFNDRIFIFTPKGDVIDLPEDASPIDFAYSIHSDIGNHIAGIKINGKMSQIFSKLKNGDIVEILTKKDSHPSSKWLDHTRTSIAKKHIRSYLEKNSLLAKFKSIGNS